MVTHLEENRLRVVGHIAEVLVDLRVHAIHRVLHDHRARRRLSHPARVRHKGIDSTGGEQEEGDEARHGGGLKRELVECCEF